MFRLRKECAVSRNGMYALLLALLLPLMNAPCLAIPLNNVFDTQPIYTVYGAERFFSEKDKGEIRIHFSPFYQQTRTARDNNGLRVPAGDRRGQTNAFALFFGPNGALPGTFGPRLSAAQAAVAAATAYNPGASSATNANEQCYHSQVNQAPDPGLTSEATFSKPYPASPTTVTPAGGTAVTTVNMNNYFAYISQPLDYEKMGVRMQLSFDFGFGLGIVARGGLVDVRQTPHIKHSTATMIFNPTFLSDAVGTVPSGGGPATGALTEAQQLATKFLNQGTITSIASELGIDLSPFHKTCPEDLHLQLYWNVPVDCLDREGEVAMTFIPNLSAGIWFPTGKKSNVDQPFSVPTGNDGFYGITVEGSLGFDFPIMPPGDQALQFLALGGLLVSTDRNQPIVRVGTSTYQSGLIPWKTTIHRQPGLTWYLGASFVAEEFLEGLSFYCDFLNTQHLSDSIQLHESVAARAAAFAAGLPRFVRETSWTNQQVNVGFNYKLAEAIALGGAVQAHIAGTRVYRSVTVLGGITILF